MLTPDNVNLYEVMIMHYVNFHVNDGDRHEFIRSKMSDRAEGRVSESVRGFLRASSELLSVSDKLARLISLKRFKRLTWN